MKLANSIWNEVKQVALYGNIASHSDIEVGARALEVGIWGAYRNVLINLPQIQDQSFKDNVHQEASEIVKQAEINCKEVLEIIEQRIN